MLFPRIIVASLLAVVSVVAAAPSRRTDAGINSPADGAVIAPGQAFDFSYNTMGDYGISSYNFTVWLVSQLPTSLQPSSNFMDGWYFGRFSEENYPGNPSPINPPPAQLVMPNFSQSPGGFGEGETGSNVTMYFVVLEEYATFTGVLGNRMSMSMKTITYNGTTSS